MTSVSNTCSSFDIRVRFLGNFSPSPQPTEAMLLFQKTRADNSLVLLTRKFAQRLNHCLGGVVDLNLVSSELKVSKRRLYDITNVLEGINLMKKTFIPGKICI
uniref:E2F/DP family winged-helix DNA-binding domain-containing protein n=2 Tax=Xiphophorus TaxID=8082 RepID=A0A3B5R2C0_XIPMA